MPDMSVGKLYSWAMKDTNSLARGFTTPDVLEANAAVIVKPGQEAIVFIDDDLKHFDQIGTHVMTGTMRVNIADAIRIARAGGSVHTSFASAITIFDVRTRLFPPETLTLPTASGEEVYITLSGAYRIVNVPLMVRSALPMTPSRDDPGAFDLRADSDFVCDIVNQMVSIAQALLRQETAAALTPAEAAKNGASPRPYRRNRTPGQCFPEPNRLPDGQRTSEHSGALMPLLPSPVNCIGHPQPPLRQ